MSKQEQSTTVENKPHSGNGKNSRNRKRNNYRGKQGRKDSSSKRINLDNERVATFVRDMEKDHNNDVAWYAHNPELLKSAGSYGFSYLTGQALPFLGDAGKGMTTPGIMAIQWVPSFGGGDINAINQAANAIYSYVVHANSRSKSYDATDLMLVIQATEQVFSMLAAMIRAYGTARNYSDRDTYTPDALLTAMGFQPDDIRANLPQMWFDINSLVSQVVQLWIPKNMPFVARRFWMNTNVYRDANSPKAQYYLYVQGKYFMYSETRFQDGGCIEPAYYLTASNSAVEFNPGTSAYTWSAWMQVINRMISRLLDSQDRGIMLGDVLKAYGKENLYSIAEVPVDYRITYTYSPEVLSQMENSTCYQDAQWILGLKQDPNTNTLKTYYYRPGSSATSGDKASRYTNTVAQQLVLNFHQPEIPTPEQVMVATRMMCPSSKTFTAPVDSARLFVQEQKPSTHTVKELTLVLPESTGTEVVSNYGFYYIGAGNVIQKYEHPLMLIETTPSAVPATLCWLWSAFDWSPWIYATNGDTLSASTSDPTTTSPIEVWYAYGDWDQFTIVTANDLNKLHTAAVYSEFGVPVL